MDIIVKNLTFSVGEKDLMAIFSSYGRVASATMTKDGQSGMYKAVIVMDQGGERAIEKLDGQIYKGKTISVQNVATMAEAEA